MGLGSLWWSKNNSIHRTRKSYDLISTKKPLINLTGIIEKHPKERMCAGMLWQSANLPLVGVLTNEGLPTISETLC